MIFRFFNYFFSSIDGTTGTTANIGTLAIGVLGSSIDYGINLGTGLRIINSATEDITIVWS